MELVVVGLFLIIASQFGYIIYIDEKNRQEREKMRVLIKSRDVVEYKDTISPPDPDTEEERDEYIEIDEIEPEQLLKADDNI